MDCQECKQKLSAFMDSELDIIEACAVRDHLSACLDCCSACSELAMMLDSCKDAAADLMPNGSKKMWIGISNVIEAEAKPLPPPRPRFTFLRAVTAMAVIAVVSSVATIFVLRTYDAPPGDDAFGAISAKQTTVERFLSSIGLTDTPQQAREKRLQEQRTAIEYWNARVQARRSQWDPRTREAFDRNLSVIDESLNEYSMILSQDPDDELSGEMLDTVMHEKMDLLRDFADL
jgi:hypothetical protein